METSLDQPSLKLAWMEGSSDRSPEWVSRQNALVLASLLTYNKLNLICGEWCGSFNLFAIYHHIKKKIDNVIHIDTCTVFFLKSCLCSPGKTSERNIKNCSFILGERWESEAFLNEWSRDNGFSWCSWAHLCQRLLYWSDVMSRQAVCCVDTVNTDVGT